MYMVAARVSTHLFILKHSCFSLIATISVASRYEIMCDLDSLLPSVSKEVKLEEEEIIGRRRYSARTIRRIREPLGSREEGAICRGNNTKPNLVSGSIKRYSDQSRDVIPFDWWSVLRRPTDSARTEGDGQDARRQERLPSISRQAVAAIFALYTETDIMSLPPSISPLLSIFPILISSALCTITGSIIMLATATTSSPLV